MNLNEEQKEKLKQKLEKEHKVSETSSKEKIKKDRNQNQIPYIKSTTEWIKTPLSIEFLSAIAILLIPVSIILGILILVNTEFNSVGIIWGISVIIGGIINGILLEVISNVARNIHRTRVYTQLRFELETTEENLTEIEKNYTPL